MFKQAIIKLTSFYVTIIMIISVSFSTFMYINVLNNTKRALEFQQGRIERKIEQFENERFIGPKRMGILNEISEEALLQIRERVFTTLLLLNFFILVSSSFLGYLLAKKTLEPINQMINKQKLFISSAAHDLKTPLTAIKTNLEVNLLNNKISVSDAKKVMNQVIKEVDELNQFTNKLLTQSKYSTDYKIVLTKTNLLKVIQNVLNSLNVLATKKQIKINLKDKKVIYANANYISLQEVLTNILENAIKYSHPNSNITVNICTKNNYAYIKVKDTGIGISKKNLSNVFEPFFKEDESRENLSNGSHGLGLTIANEIIQKLNGKIIIKSVKNKGTTVYIKLHKFNKLLT